MPPFGLSNEGLSRLGLVVIRRLRIVRLSVWIPGAIMIGKLFRGESMRVALLYFGQHGRIPLKPRARQLLIDVRMAIFEVRALQRIIDDIEQKSILQDLEKFIVSIAGRSLGVCLVSPEQLARQGRSAGAEQR